ncbi:MAG: hypothetical protein QM808_17700 [Steroidobacteraceae bacterium]
MSEAERTELLIGYIDGERRRLMQATAVLDTMRIAMEETEQNKSDEPLYSDVTVIARDIVNHAINRLDSLSIRSLIVAAQ